MKVSIGRYRAAMLVIVMLAAGFLVTSARPAAAAAIAQEVNCSFVNTVRLQCNIPVLSTNFNATIIYGTMQCGTTGTITFDLQQFQILATPPGGTSEVAYQVAGDRGMVKGVVNAASIVHIPVTVNTTSRALIDLSVAPSGTTQCSVSVAADY
jgi:hypothetical protein